MHFCAIAIMLNAQMPDTSREIVGIVVENDVQLLQSAPKYVTILPWKMSGL